MDERKMEGKEVRSTSKTGRFRKVRKKVLKRKVFLHTFANLPVFERCDYSITPLDTNTSQV